jgi:nucleotide-binding universal stress UspA family protein
VSIFPTKILLATDGSKEAGLAAETASEVARQTNSELHVVYVLALPLDTQDPSSFEPEVRLRMEEGARARLEEEVRGVESSGGQVAGSHLALGRPDARIVEEAEEIGAGLIVLGSRGFGPVRQTLVGSVSDSVVRHAHCPVMVVRAEALAFPARILLATDGSEEADLAAATATDLAKGTGSELHVVCVGHMPRVFYESPAAFMLDVDLHSRMEEDAERAARTTLEEQVRKLKEAGGEVAEAHARVGHPDTEIVGLAGRLGAGLIVVGSRGLGSLKRALMGSVSDSVVRHAPCPVLVVRPER